MKAVFHQVASVACKDVRRAALQHRVSHRPKAVLIPPSSAVFTPALPNSPSDSGTDFFDPPKHLIPLLF
jgi:hypothetical protein